jgi:cellulose synthase/poly-beta-1,6-N-acetylglucosamine synthase-like glycosyltransferase
MIDVLITPLEILGLGLCLFVGLLVLADVYLIAVHLREGRRQLLREAADDRQPGAEKPLVCLQLPVFNEPRQIGPAIDALCALDWPRDRLEIQILDDSTDETSTIAAERVARWREKGLAVSHVVRGDRKDYKAGALAAGMQHTGAPYLAIFDADYRPAPSFLHRAMPALLADGRVAFVQARLDYRNREANDLTQAQALELDTFQAYEQAARNWAGIPTTFNGTCGIWRRRAIEEAGGWSGRSLVEDQDLSFRAFAQGFTRRNLVSIAVEGELPEEFGVLVGQRQRWGTGTAQAFRALPWRLLRHLRWHQAAAFILLANYYAGVSLALLATAAVTILACFLDPARAAVIALALFSVMATIAVVKTIGAALAARLLGRKLGAAFVADVVRMWLLEIVLLPVVARSLAIGYLTRQTRFLRTPKKGR